jgi:hypothetical protein
MDCTENDAFNSSSIVVIVFVAAVTFLRWGLHIHTDKWQRFMKHPAQMGAGAMMDLQSLIKTASGIRKLITGIHRQHGDCISLVDCAHGM